MAKTKIDEALTFCADISVGDIKPYKNNARTHSDKQINQIKKSILEFGFTNPILVDGDLNVIAGHGRLEAVKAMGWLTVPCIQITNMSDAAKRAYILADNKIAANAGWDNALLRLELGDLVDEFDLDAMGFEQAEIDKLFDQGVVSVEDIPAGDLDDTFWISVRGPLRQQHNALKKLQDFMSDFPGVEVDIGTVAVDP